MLNNRNFTKILSRLDCASVLWTKQGRKNLYISDVIEIKNYGHFNPIKVVGIKSGGRIIGFKVTFMGGQIHYYILHRHIYNLTKTQLNHFNDWVASFDEPYWTYRRLVRTLESN